MYIAQKTNSSYIVIWVWSSILVSQIAGFSYMYICHMLFHMSNGVWTLSKIFIQLDPATSGECLGTRLLAPRWTQWWEPEHVWVLAVVWTSQAACLQMQKVVRFCFMVWVFNVCMLACRLTRLLQAVSSKDQPDARLSSCVEHSAILDRVACPWQSLHLLTIL